MTCLNLASAGGAARADCADNAAFDIAAGTDLLILAAIKKSSADTGAIIFGKQDHYWFETTGSGYVRGKFNHSVDGVISMESTTAPTLSTWEWLILSYDYSAGDASIFLAGTRLVHQTGISVSGGVSDGGSTGFSLGDPAGTASFQGLIQEVYVSTDITGYSPASASVSDPSVTFTADANTICLYHCDEGTGTTLDNAEGTAALDLSFASSPRDPSWNTTDSVFATANGSILLSAANNGGF